MRTKRFERGKSCESLPATIQLRGQDYTFRLYNRPLKLGDYGMVDYYWMDSSQFRNLRSEAECSNFRSILGFWAAAMHEDGVQHELDQQIHYVLAQCYPLVARSKGLQRVYRDAYLHPTATDDTTADALSEEIRDRIRDVLASRDRVRVQEELDAALGRFEPDPRVLPLLQEACLHWVSKGVVLMRQRDNDGIVQFLGETEYWLAKFRRRSKRWVRHYIDLFSYECKVAFYTCYANAWVGLIPWLRENRGLDTLSERFLRFWHNQNQPIEIPLGRTLGGIIYPTQRGLLVADQSENAVRSMEVDMKQVGPGHVRDVFSGQVLSLHPLSAFFMKDPALCAVAGRYFSSDTCEQDPRFISRCDDYWHLIGAILTAARLYRQALDRQAQERGVHRRPDAETCAVEEPGVESDARILEDFAAAQGIRCPACRGKVAVSRIEPGEPNASEIEAEFTCSSCQHIIPVTITWQDLDSWLHSPS